MTDGIPLISDENQLVAMSLGACDAEARSQGFLEHDPDFLAGDRIDDAAWRRGVPHTREAGVPAEATGTGRGNPDQPYRQMVQMVIPNRSHVKRNTCAWFRRVGVGQLREHAVNDVSCSPAEAAPEMSESPMRRTNPPRGDGGATATRTVLP